MGMKWYWSIDCTKTVKNPFVSNSDNLEQKGYEELAFYRGMYIKGWDDSAWIRAVDEAHDGDPDDVIQSHLGLPIYSLRLRETLEGAGIKGIQYLPIKVYRPNGDQIEGFSLVNVLHLLSALDMEKSDYDVFPDDYFYLEDRGKVMGIRNAVLKADVVQGYDIIRLQEYYVGLYVSERFKRLFRQHKFTGYSFYEVELS
jgi:Immunity protein family (Imm11)